MAQTVKNKQIVVTSDFDINTHKIINVVDPTNNQDVATKYYVDAVAQGISPHAPVRVVSTGNTTLSGTITIDDIPLTNGNFVLVAGQTDKTKNGIYTVNSGGSWTRRPDADGNPSNEIQLGDFVFVETGVTNMSSGWVLSKTNATGSTITPDVDTQEWYKMAAPGSYTADGIGIQLIGNVFTISAEISTRTSNDNLLFGAISTEVSNRTVADGLLSTAISSESSSRVSGDESLSTAISAVSGDTTDVTTLLSDNQVLGMISGNLTGVSYSTIVSSEASIRLSVDESLSTAISGGGGRPVALSGLTDVSVASLADNDILVWISGDSLWENRNSLSSLSTVISTGDDSLSTAISINLSTNNDSLSTAISENISSDLDSLSTVISTDISTGNDSLSTAISENISSADSSLSIEVSTNISSSDDSLSTVISTNMSTELDSLSTVISTDVSTELESLSTNISTDISTGNDSLSTAISENISSADSSLSIEVSTNISSSDDSLSTVISTNISTSNDSLSTAISSNVSSELDSLSTAISSEIISGNDSLSIAITTEISSSDVSLSTVISTTVSTETSDRISGDESLSTAIISLSGETENITNNLLQGDLIYFTGTTLSGTTNLMPSLSTAVNSLSTVISGISMTTSLYQLTDVSISSAVTGDILVYDADWSRWENVLLSTAISGETSVLASSDTSLSAAISGETTSRISNDGLLFNAISTEVSNRAVADGLLSSAISSEASSRTSGDLSLSTGVSTEISSRTSGDVSLSTSISSEASLRTSGDVSLSTSISSEASLRTSVDSSLSTAIGGISPTMSLSGLTDVSFTGVTNNDVLTFSGSTWTNKPNLWTESNSAVTLSNPSFDLSLSNIDMAEDGGVLTFVDMSVTSGASYGTEESYSFNIDGNPVVKVYSQSNGSGSTQNTGLVLDGDYYYAGNPTTNGSWRWFVNIDGDLEFQKLTGGTWTYKSKFS